MVFNVLLKHPDGEPEKYFVTAICISHQNAMKIIGGHRGAFTLHEQEPRKPGDIFYYRGNPGDLKTLW